MGVEKGRDELKVRVEGQHLQRHSQKLSAALAGLGLAYVPEDVGQPHLAKAVSSGCLRTGVSHIPAITSIIRAGGSPRQRSRSWSTRYGIENIPAGSRRPQAPGPLLEYVLRHRHAEKTLGQPT